MADQVFERQLEAGLGEFEFRADQSGDGLTVAGYIARFNQPTEITDFLGTYMEQIQPGAFARSIAERGPAKVRMQFNHGHDPAFGQLPIGVWTSLREDRKGLFGEGRILDTWHTIPIRAAIESGALDGMSFRFKVISAVDRKAKSAAQLDQRTLTEVALFEAGVVVNPAYEGTSIGIRSQALDLYRAAYITGDDALSAGRAAIVEDEVMAVPPVGDTGSTRTEADPPDGITRHDMRLRALTLLGVFPNDQDRGAA